LRLPFSPTKPQSIFLYLSSCSARKLLNIRLWPNNEDKAWASSVKAKEYEVLLVSQFTLYGCLKGNKPGFHNAMGPTEAKVRIVDVFIPVM
jgi:D-Tyr-tRNAtyr deacylase